MNELLTYLGVDTNIPVPVFRRERSMRHASRNDDYIARRDINFDAIAAFFAVGRFWTSEN